MPRTNTVTAHIEAESPMASHQWSRWKAVYLYGLFLLISTFGDNLKIGPEVRLYELLVCRRYFLEHDPSKVDGDGNVEERHCKLDAIQAELSVLRGWVFSSFLFVGTLVTIPYGVVADSMGRKVVVAASLISVTLPKAWIIAVCYFWGTFQPSAILVSAVFRFFGGGYSVMNAVVLAAVTDAVPEDKRTTTLFYIGTMTLISELAAPPLGSVIMTGSSPLMAVVVAVMVESLAIFVLPFIPETLQHTAAAEHEALNGDVLSYGAVAQPEPEQPPPSQNMLSARITGKVKAMAGGLGEAARFAIKDRNILFTLPSFLLPIIAQELMAFLLQYTSTRFGWTLAAATTLTSMRPAMTIVLYTLLLPTLNRFLLMRVKLSAGNADLVAAKASPVLSILGLLMIGSGSTPWLLGIGLVVFTLGYGYTQSAQLFLASRVEKDQLGLLYTVTATISAIGGILGAPLIAQALNLGSRLSGMWLGLPFFVGAGIYALSSIGVWKLSFT